MALVEQQVGSKPVTAETVPDVLNREALPVLRRLRALVNARLDSAATTVGDGVTTVFVLEHEFATRDLTVTVYDAATYQNLVEGSDVTSERTSADEVTVTFAVAPAVDGARVLLRP